MRPPLLVDIAIWGIVPQEARPTMPHRNELPIRTVEILSALSYALDLTEGQPFGHAAHACLIAQELGKEIGLRDEELADLYYASLLKDAGCSGNASRLYNILGSNEIEAKRDVKVADWTAIGWDTFQYALAHVRRGRPFLERMAGLLQVAINQKRDSREVVQIRCTRGASIARKIGLNDRIAEAIQNLDEHWDGKGYPEGRRADAIPMLARILNLSQTLEVFVMEHDEKTALEMAQQRRETWFDPDLVHAALCLAKRGRLFSHVSADKLLETVIHAEPLPTDLKATEQQIDAICEAFADVVDAKSPFTFRHSMGVAEVSDQIAQTMGVPIGTRRLLRRAALLHDIGKLSVPNSILEKPGKLTNEEFAVVKRHAFYTHEILRRIPHFEEFAFVAAAHHEKLDGSGYFQGLTGEHLSRECRILAVADIFDALAMKRPYRDPLPLDEVLRIIDREVPLKLDPECFEALQQAKLQTVADTDESQTWQVTQNSPVEHLAALQKAARQNSALQNSALQNSVQEAAKRQSRPAATVAADGIPQPVQVPPPAPTAEGLGNLLLGIAAEGRGQQVVDDVPVQESNWRR